jgi:hypothetical protein
MTRSLSVVLALAVAASAALFPVAGRASDRALPMRFDLYRQGPAEACGAKCRVLISATGAITADTPDDFKKFAQGHDLAGAMVVLDSDGGSVHGAIALGREFRRLALDTAVGRTVDVTPTPQGGVSFAALSPRANCESMCAFVLLAGIHRVVPDEARVMVHQIWLGDRREDPTAANYSAEDLVLVQRDIGRLARYTEEMGVSIDMLDLSLRIPPWEPMHAMTRDELRRMRVATDAPSVATGATAAVSPAAATTVPVLTVANGVDATRISERRWAMVDRSGARVLARHHPLTVEGEDIGSFDLLVSCGAGGDSYDVSYVERRHAAKHTPLPAMVGTITLQTAGREAPLKLVSSERRSQPDELVTYAAGPVPAALIDGFAALGNHSLTVETKSGRLVTGIRIGNTGAQQNLPRLAGGCAKPIGDRAELTAPKTGGLASAK